MPPESFLGSNEIEAAKGSIRKSLQLIYQERGRNLAKTLAEDGYARLILPFGENTSDFLPTELRDFIASCYKGKATGIKELEIGLLRWKVISNTHDIQEKDILTVRLTALVPAENLRQLLLNNNTLSEHRIIYPDEMLSPIVNFGIEGNSPYYSIDRFRALPIRESLPPKIVLAVAQTLTAYAGAPSPYLRQIAIS